MLTFKSDIFSRTTNFCINECLILTCVIANWSHCINKEIRFTKTFVQILYMYCLYFYVIYTCVEFKQMLFKPIRFTATSSGLLLQPTSVVTECALTNTFWECLDDLHTCAKWFYFMHLLHFFPFARQEPVWCWFPQLPHSLSVLLFPQNVFWGGWCGVLWLDGFWCDVL